MDILICPDSYKGTLTAREAALAIEKGITERFSDVVSWKIPLADGGYGTLDVIAEHKSCTVIEKKVRGPLGNLVPAKYLLFDRSSAFIEMAQAAGLVLLKESERNPLLTTTYGVGELILDAVKNGCKSIYLGLGGSATNDGGMGMAEALGVKFIESAGKEVAFRKKQGYSGGSLRYIAGIDIKGMNPKLKECRFIILSDVTNPLCGENGASAVYGPQKGATPEMIEELDSSLMNYAKIIRRDIGKDVLVPGAGAAGGLGAGIIAFLGAEIRSGVEEVIKLVGFEEYVKKSDLIITGEGRVDSQTVHGKTISGIARIAAKHNVPVIAIGGCLGQGYMDVRNIGIVLVYDACHGIKYDMGTLKKNASKMLCKAAGDALAEYRKKN